MRPEARTLAPLGRVLPPLLWAAGAEVVAWALLLAPGALDPGWYGRPGLLAGMHALTVGTLATAIVGAGWQMTPVIVARTWNPAAAPWINGAIMLALPPLLWGLAHPGSPVGHAGATLTILALGLRAVLTIPALLRAKGRHAVRAWIVGAEASLLAGIVLATLLYLGRAGVPVLADPVGGVHRHAGLLLGGWIGGWIVGAGGLLLPMFAVAREPRPLPMAVAAVAWFGGLALGVPLLWGAGALIAAAALGHALRTGLRAGAPLRQTGVGLVGAAVTVALAPWAPTDATLAAGLTLGALPFLHGVTQHIVPFFVWTHRYGGHPQGAPSPSSFSPDRLPAVQAVLSVGGGVALVASRLGVPALAVPGAVALLAGALVQIAFLATVLVRAERHRTRRDALAGMEA